MPILFKLANETLIYNEGDGRIRIQQQDVTQFQAWARRYEEALIQSRDATPFFTLGREIFDWLNRDGWLSTALEQGVGALEILFAVPTRPNKTEQAFLHIPWELLASTEGYLAQHSTRLFVPMRRLGEPDKTWNPLHRDMHLIFMAASPRGVTALNYEQEEAEIIEQTRRSPLTLTVEESGSLSFLGEMVVGLPAQPEAIHISCHGNIKNHQSYLLLEDEEGHVEPATAGALAHQLGQRLPPLLFLSACRTAEGRGESTSLAIEMVQSGCANVIGWDGSVSDQDALLFAGHFYQQLARHETVGWAAATARRALLHAQERDARLNHWHLARFVMGPDGGGRLCQSHLKTRKLSRNPGKKEFLDKERGRGPVANREQFVGRRRTIQRIIAAFRKGKPGVLIYGMGCVGKSSLAARLANRLPHYQTALVFEQYDAVAVLDAILRKLPAATSAELRTTWHERVKNSATSLGEALHAILEGPCYQFDPAADTKPLLLIIDDLEQILEPADGNRSATPFKTTFQPVMRAILEAFQDVESDSRIIFTSRYQFTLRGSNGQELAELLLHEPLSGLSQAEQQKQWKAENRHTHATPDETLLERVLRAAQGNPGLQNLLTRPILNKASQDAERAVAQVEKYLKTGLIPQEDIGDFFRRMTLESYRSALTPSQQNIFRALTLFQQPVPWVAVEAVLKTVGGQIPPEDILHRFLGLGLLNQHEMEENALTHWITEPLARPLFLPPLTPAEEKALAQAVLPPLFAAWRKADGTLPWSLLTLEAFRLAQMAADPPAMEESAIEAGFWLFNTQHEARIPLAMVQDTVTALNAAQIAPSPKLLRLGMECAERLGETPTRRVLLEQAIALPQDDTVEWAELWREYANMLVMEGDIATAEQWLRRAEGVFQQHDEIRSRAVVMDKIADILAQQGQLDEALRIRLYEQLPVFEKLGDIHSRAITMGKIADILFQQGKSDEALHIRQNALLPVYEKLGDIRARAITMGQIADILFQQGQSDEALRIRQKEQLPVYEKLGDIRSRAITMGKIADILFQQGQSDEALHIRQHEELPVYEKLGDIHSRAVTMGKIADILAEQGQLDEALRMQEERIPIAVQMGDLDSHANALFAMARLQLSMKPTDLKSWQNILDNLSQSFAMNNQIGRADGIAFVGAFYGQVLAQRGKQQEAITVLEKSKAAFRLLQWEEQAQQVATLIRQIQNIDGTP